MLFEEDVTMRARDVMTGSLITSLPHDPIAEVARLMRDRNTGDVLVADQGRLLGIVTDRDIAVRVAATEVDPSQAPVRQFMSKHVVTGRPDWKLDRVAKVMGKHQVRRLPIVDRGMLVGIVSLGDLALRGNRAQPVAKSLREISEPGKIHRQRRGRGRLATTVALGLVAGAAVALTLSPKQLTGILGQVQQGPLGDALAQVWNELRRTL
jgi:CBS domain-containing protein